MVATRVPWRENQTSSGPQAGIVEAGGLAKSVVAVAVGVAGKVIEELEFAEDGEVGGVGESESKFGQGSDLVAEEVLADGLGIEGERSHNVIVPTDRRL